MKEYNVDGKIINVVLENGKNVKIMTDFIKNMMNTLGLDEEDAILTWLEDEEYLINDEQEELNTEAKKYKIGAKATDSAKPRTKREVVRKENPIKRNLIAYLEKALTEYSEASNINVENQEKIITFCVGDVEFKLDLVQKRKPKKGNE